MSPDQTPPRPAGTSPAPDPRLVIVSREPFNAELPLPEQLGVITPTALFYARNHFPVPQLRTEDWRLRVEGDVARPLQLTYEDVRAMPSRTLLATLECAGNGRVSFQPPAEGEPWQYGAASTAEWTGTPLRDVLQAAGLEAQAATIVIDGADQGHVAAAGGTIRFARSLSREQALHSDTLLVYAMNGAPLTPEHGFPVRLLVPGWYGMAAVKWVVRIAATHEPFRGFYQVDRYVMTHPERGDASITPLEAMRVRSLIIDPAPGATLAVGPRRVHGLAWSGAAVLARVEVCVDGATWQEAQWVSPAERYAWRRWEFVWHATTSGPVELRSRAFDEAGNGQPVEPEWNRLGYANNAIQVVPITIAG